MNSMTNLTLTRMKKVITCMMTHEQIQQMFNEDSDDDEFFWFLINLLILVRLIRWFDSRGFIGPKTWCILYMSATYT